MANPLRTRLRKTLLAGTDAKIARQQRQLETQAKRLDTQAAKQTKQLESVRTLTAKVADGNVEIKRSVDRLTSTMIGLSKRTDDLSDSVADVLARATEIETAMTRREVELERRRAQLGAVEERLGRIDEQLRMPGRDRPGEATLDDAGAAEAIDLLQQIRREHEQIRIRMQIVASYEERLRRVEESLVDLYNGDERHQM